jgi:hypothetical protein
MVPARVLEILACSVAYTQDGPIGVARSPRADGARLLCYDYVTNTQMDLADEQKL